MENVKTTCQLIPDPALRRGFRVLSQKDHENGDAVQIVGEKPCCGEAAPLWRLASWDSGPDLWRGRIESDDFSISDGSYRAFSVAPEEKKLSFLLDTESYYQGKAAKLGDFWPHLLIEMPSFGEFVPYDCTMQKLLLTMEIRMPEYRATPHPDNWVEAAQFLTFFYLKGKTTDDFIWFGAQLFDSRWAESDFFCAVDGGKPDASGRLIYSAGLRDVYRNSPRSLWRDGKPFASDTWIPVSIDLKPHLDKAFSLATERGCVSCSSLSDLVIDGMNIGWESIATFRHRMEIRDLKLTACY